MIFLCVLALALGGLAHAQSANPLTSGARLHYSDGPASFNAEATLRGHRVVSCDPIYRFGRSQIQERIAATYDEVLAQTRLNAHEFVWGDGIRNVEELGQVRMAAMQAFLEDFESGKHEGRYVDAELPTVPFENGTFELALCSHFLFLYSTQLGEVFHRAALHEMCRVAGEVRVFPLLALGGERSPFVDPALAISGRRGITSRSKRSRTSFSTAVTR